MTRVSNGELLPALARIPNASAEWAYFLDVDGTLVEFASSPTRVLVDGALRDLILRTHQAANGAMALVSGRSIASLDALLSLSNLPIAGQHGAEHRSADGVLTVSKPRSPLLDDVRAALDVALADHAGLLIEDKGSALAVHYRQAPRLADFVLHTVKKIAEPSAAEYEILSGNCVVELKPFAVNKGTAVRDFMREAPFFGRIPAFIGDDVTDEDGFDAVNALGGISVKVGRGATRAHWRLRDVDAVRAWLGAMPSATQTPHNGTSL